MHSSKYGTTTGTLLLLLMMMTMTTMVMMTMAMTLTTTKTTAHYRDPFLSEAFVHYSLNCIYFHFLLSLHTKPYNTNVASCE